MKAIVSVTILLLVLTGAGIAQATSSVIVNEDFSGVADPLSYFYQDEGVSHDSFYWDDANDNMGGEARRGRNGWNDNPDLIIESAERAYLTFSCAGYGDADEYLEYTEAFDFSFDFNFSSFVSSSNQEQVMLGFWYTEEDAEDEHPLIIRAWANHQHFVGVKIKGDGSEVRLCLIHGNGADWVGKAKSDDLTNFGPNPIGSLSTGVNYRVEGSYRWDGSTYGQIFGRLTDIDTSTVVGDIPQETITQDEPDIYSVGYNNMNIDQNNHRFTKHRVIGAGNETWGVTRNPGAQFTSDNWVLEAYDPVELASINIRPPINAVYLGGSAKLLCEGYDSGGTRYDVSEWVNWTSLDPSIVSIDEENLTATGSAAGSTNIKAAFADLESPLVPFQVLPPRSPNETSYGLDVLLQWREMPLIRNGVEAGMASSYDRNFNIKGTTGDCNNYDFPTGYQGGNVDPVTVRELTGPGLITRTWMPWLPGPEFKLKFYFDGETTPRLDTTTLEWYDSGVSGHPWIEDPLVGIGTGGAWCYTPLYFQDSLKIESNNVSGKNNFYQMNYLYLPGGTEVDTYTGTQDYTDWADWNMTAGILDAVGSNPGPSGSQVVQTSGIIPASGTMALAELENEEGVITRLQIKLNNPTDVQLAGLELKVFYDGSAQADIDMLLREFFGVGRDRISYKAMSLGTEHPDGYYCYLPMPFREGVRIELNNSSAESVDVTLAEVEYEPQNVEKKYGYLHAQYRSEHFVAADDHMYEVLSVPEGEGHYLGCILTVTPETTDLNYLEGNDRIQVDGETKETLYGTGLEDAFNGGYYYTSPYGGPFSGLLQKDNGVTSQYRHRIIDMIPFEQSILVEYQGVDIDYWGDQYARDYESTAYWYQKQPGPPELQIQLAGENMYHLSWDEAGAYDLEFDTSLAFDSPDVVDVTGLAEYDYYTGEDCGFFRLKEK